jgi:hypothetical protein
VDRIARDVDRDYIMSPEQAVEYGMIDRVIASRDLVPVAVTASTYTSSSRCRKGSTSAEGRRAGMRHEVSSRRLTGGSSMRIMVPMPHSGHSRRFFPVRAA